MPYYYEKINFDQYLAKLESAIYRPVAPLQIEAWLTPEPIPFAIRTTGEHQQMVLGQAWGRLWDCAWMHVTGEVPPTAQGHKIVLLIDFNGEGCVVDTDGNPLLGLTTVNSEYDTRLGWPGKKVVPITEQATGNEKIDLWIEAGANDLFGKLQENGILREAQIAICNESMRSLYYDFFVLCEMVTLMPEHSARRAHIVTVLANATKCFITYSDDEAAQARQILAPELAKTGGSPSLAVSAIGHAHMDLAWLWPLRETIRKGARTFATVLAMMDRYPDYVFGSSQPQLYQWMKDHYPALYERVKQKIAEGRWEVQGSMWVEADVNISGGEALIRQMLLGQRFFRNEFGKTSKIMWMPDVFGYSGALPQLMKKSGLDYFMTIKLSWSKFNVFPHHTFSWQGIDGSKVLAHMPPEGTYNSSAAPRAIAATERNYLDKYVSENALLVYGIGDGGGGPGEEHLERLDREKNLDGLPPVTQEPAADFFERIAAEIDNYKTWSGELYLEYHQGTLTSQARNKRFNRKLELALRDLEWLAVAASAHAGYEYPQATLETIWKEMLLYQFHDILPGSSITRVYDESRARYQILLDQTQALYDQAATALISQIDTQGITTPVVALNTLSWDRAEWVHYDNIWMKLGVPAMGYLAAELTPSPVDGPVLSADPSSLENGDLRITFAADGSISSIYDKTNQREVIADGSAANVLTVYSDPGDAWDFAFDYAEKPSQRFSLVSAEPSIDGPQALLHQRWQFGDSTLSQRVILTAGSRRIDFVTEVDWQENAKMLRTSFPLSVRAALATCEIQFGTIQRPTHTNTSWDLAKYEIPAHKWVDLSQRDYGVALLNDCKYGYHVSENTLDLNLLRSPHFPDPVADRAVHQFTYALYPHAGDHVEGGVTRAGYELNVPLRLAKTDAHAGTLPATTSLLSVNAENVIVEAVKKAEDSNATILRLYEAHGASVTTTIKLYDTPTNGELVSMMEDSVSTLTTQDNQLSLTFSPFEIQSVKVTF